LWVRRALFQLHLWAGLVLGAYVVAVSLSGSVLVFRIELLEAVTPDTVVVEPIGERLDDDALRAAAEVHYAGYRVVQMFKGRFDNQAVEVWLTNPQGRVARLFHPFTGDDLGPAIAPGVRAVSWLLDLHDNLLFGETGRTVNGLAGALFTVLAATGVLIWWPGRGRWFKGMYVQIGANWKRVNWSLHSALGFWTALILILWGVSGVYLVFPDPFNEVADFVEPFDDETFEPRAVDEVLRWLARLHFGRFGGLGVKVLWAAIGLVPPILFATGAIMWWNRVVRKVSARPPMGE
jgi:uncharacterized iron-regulated membrane protein